MKSNIHFYICQILLVLSLGILFAQEGKSQIRDIHDHEIIGNVLDIQADHIIVGEEGVGVYPIPKSKIAYYKNSQGTTFGQEKGFKGDYSFITKLDKPKITIPAYTISGLSILSGGFLLCDKVYKKGKTANNPLYNGFSDYQIYKTERDPYHEVYQNGKSREGFYKSAQRANNISWTLIGVGTGVLLATLFVDNAHKFCKYHLPDKKSHIFLSPSTSLMNLQRRWYLNLAYRF